MQITFECPKYFTVPSFNFHYSPVQWVLLFPFYRWTLLLGEDNSLALELGTARWSQGANLGS